MKLYLKFFLFLAIGIICRFDILKLKRRDIIVVRIDNIGDFILWLENIHCIRENFKDKNITLLCKEEVKEFAIDCGFFDYVIPLNSSKFSNNITYRYNFLKKIRRYTYSTLIHPTYSRSLLAGDFICFGVKARLKIGYEGDLSNSNFLLKRITNLFYTKLVPVNPFLRSEKLINRHFTRQLFNDNPPRLEIKKLNNFATRNILPENYCVIFPGGTDESRVWELNKFLVICNYLSDKYCLKVLICGSSSEVERNKSIFTNPFIINLTGKTSLSDLVELIRSASIVITNETSAAHIAHMVNTKVVTILGGGHFGRFLPYPTSNNLQINVFKKMECFNCNWKCNNIKYSRNIYPCISDISVNDVIKNIDLLLM